MKNNKNRKRVLPLLLAMLLLIGAGAYGTRAFFSDQEALKTSIDITTGTIDIVAVDSNWKYVPNSNSTIPAYNINSQLKVNDIAVNPTMNMILGSEIIVTNARPGDAFTMEVEVTNNSTLDMLISDTFTAPTYDAELYSFEFTSKLGAATTATAHNSSDTMIKAKETITYYFKVTVNNLASNNYNPVKINLSAKFALANITLNAKQPNAN